MYSLTFEQLFENFKPNMIKTTYDDLTKKTKRIALPLVDSRIILHVLLCDIPICCVDHYLKLSKFRRWRWHFKHTHKSWAN
jgi:hypothetical protein